MPVLHLPFVFEKYEGRRKVKILINKTQHEINEHQLQSRINGFQSISLDIGTGSGRTVYNNAVKNPTTYYVGLDSCAAGMFENSVRMAKVEKKRKIANALFVVSSIENPPVELLGKADTISVILPWGSLRDGIIKADSQVLSNIRLLGKKKTRLFILTGYDQIIEPSVMTIRELPILSVDYFKGIAPQYDELRIKLLNVKAVDNKGLKQIDSDWAKRLAYGTERTMYSLSFEFE